MMQNQGKRGKSSSASKSSSRLPSYKINTPTKSGSFSSKMARMQRSANTLSKATPFDNLNYSLYSGKNISLKSFMPSTLTGIAGKKQIAVAQNTFLTKLKGSELISGFSKKGGNLTVRSDYQKGSFSLAPTSTKLINKGWKLDIPDSFIKTGNVYKAPTQEYLAKKHYYKRDGGKTKKGITNKTYVPTEVYINPETNKISRIVKRGINNNLYERDSEDDRYKRYDKEYTPYVSSEKDYYKTGITKKILGRTTFQNYYREDSDYDEDHVDKKRAVRLDKVSEYAATGGLLKKSLYGDYAKSNYEKNRYARGNSSDFENTRREAYLKKESVYSPNNATSVVKTYSPFRTNYKRTQQGNYSDGGRTVVRDIDQKAQLKSEQYFVGDKNIGQIDYGAAKGNTFRKVNFDRDSYEKVLLAPDHASNAYGSTPSFVNVLNPNAKPIYKDDYRYNYGVRGYSFLNPGTNKRTSERFW